MKLQLPAEHLATVDQIVAIRRAGSSRLAASHIITTIYDLIDRSDGFLTTADCVRATAEGVDPLQRRREIARIFKGLTEMGYAKRHSNRRLELTPTQAMEELAAAHNGLRKWLLGENGVRSTEYTTAGLVAKAHGLEWAETAQAVGWRLGIHPETVVHRGQEMAAAGAGILPDVLLQEHDFLHIRMREAGATPVTD